MKYEESVHGMWFWVEALEIWHSVFHMPLLCPSEHWSLMCKRWPNRKWMAWVADTPHIKNTLLLEWAINFYCVKSPRFGNWLLPQYNHPVRINTEFQITCSCCQRAWWLCRPLKVVNWKSLFLVIISFSAPFPMCRQLAPQCSFPLHHRTPSLISQQNAWRYQIAFLSKPYSEDNVYSCIVPGFK